MLVFYTIILCLSSWLITYLLMRTGERLMRTLSLEMPLIGGYVALSVTLAMMIVVAAPAWVVTLAIAVTGFSLWRHVTLIPQALTAPLLVVSVILACVLAVFGGPHWLIIDAAIMVASLAGVIHATRALPEFRMSAAGFVILQAGLFVEAILRGALHVS